MTHPKLRLALAALALTVGACDARPDAVAQGSITVKLPPARAHSPEPAFSFDPSTTPKNPTPT